MGSSKDCCQQGGTIGCNCPRRVTPSSLWMAQTREDTTELGSCGQASNKPQMGEEGDQATRNSCGASP